MWSSGQSSWLQIQRSGFDSRRYQTFWEVVGLERGPFSLVNTIEELPGKKSSGFGLENRENGRRDQSRWPRVTLYPQKLALTSPTSGGRSRIQDIEFSFFFFLVLDSEVHFAPCINVPEPHAYSQAPVNNFQKLSGLNRGRESSDATTRHFSGESNLFSNKSCSRKLRGEGFQ
jgi:hypothetical protein